MQEKTCTLYKDMVSVRSGTHIDAKLQLHKPA